MADLEAIRSGDNRRLLILLCAILIPLYFVGIGARDVWAPDEPRFAQIAQEMMDSGDWIIPHMNGEPVALMPPLTYWLMAGCSLPAGRVTEFTARIPFALAAFATVIALFLLGKKIVGERAAFLAALILAVSVKFLQQAEWIQADMLLVCFSTLSLLFFLRNYSRPAGEKRNYLPMYVFMALGTLTKGPLALILTVAPIAIFLLVRREWKTLFRLQLPVGIACYLLIVLPWYLAMAFTSDADFAHEMLIKQNFGMFFDTWSHKQPFFYYLVHFPWAFLPGALFLPAAIVYLRRDRRFLLPQYLFPIVWFVSLFLFFSISSAKQIKYILPAFPAVAIICGATLAEIDSGKLFAWGVKAPLWFFLFLMVAVVILVTAVDPSSIDAAYQMAVPILIAARPALIALALLLATAWLAFFVTNKIAVALAGVAAAFAIAIPFIRFTTIPEVNPIKSPRLMCQRAAEMVDKGYIFGVYGIHPRQAGAYLYYSGHKVRFLDELANKGEFEKFMKSEEHQLCFADEKDFLKITDGHYTVIDKQRVGEDTVVLISNR